MSWDTFLGGPFNIAEGGLLLSLVARLTGFTPKNLTIFSGDTHIYENHLPMVKEQLNRIPYPAPKLSIEPDIPTFKELCQKTAVPDDEPWPATDLAVRTGAAELAVKWLSMVKPEDFHLSDYRHYPELKAPMAV